MKRTLLTILAIILCLSALSGCSNVRNKVDPEASGLDFDTCISELEERISAEYLLKDFKLVRLGVDIADGTKNECILRIVGQYDKDGITTSWGETFDISYEDYLSLCKVNNSHIIYNSEITEYIDTIITDIPAWAIKGVYNIMFE